MADVSANDNITDQEEFDDQEEFEQESSETEIPEHIPDDIHSTNDYVYETETGDYNTIDYSAGLADISNLLKFHIAITIGFLLVVCFIIGWKHD